MSKPKKKAPVPKQPAVKAAKGREVEKPAKDAKLTKLEVNKMIASVKKATRIGTKQSILIAMLKESGGATITEMAKATGWQNHSVLGALSGVLKKRLGLTVASEKEERGRVYRIAGAR